MLKRLRWMTMGALLGWGASWWANRALRRALAPWRPRRLGDRAVTVARTLVADARAAVADGRQAMREHEALLREEPAGGSAAAEGTPGAVGAPAVGATAPGARRRRGLGPAPARPGLASGPDPASASRPASASGR